MVSEPRVGRRGPLRLVVFDMDGTLVDSQAQIVAAMEAAFVAHNQPRPDPGAVRGVVGLSLVPAIARLLPHHSRDTHLTLAQSYKDAFVVERTSGRSEAPLYPGAADTVQHLAGAGYQLAIATGKSRRGALASLEQHGLHPYFGIVQTSDDAPSKPHPAMLMQSMAEAGAIGAETMMVGDTSYDMEMAREAGAWAVGVSWGYHAHEDLVASGAERVLQSFDQLHTLVSRRS